MKNINILFVGDSSYDVYVQSFFRAASLRPDINAYLFDFGCMNLLDARKNLVLRTEYHFRFGIVTDYTNKKLLRLCRRKKFDIVFFYSCPIIYSSTVAKIARNCNFVAVYHNDDPFSVYYKKWFWRHFKKAVQYADIAYAYRESNFEAYREYGAKDVRLLKAYYIKERNYYIDDSQIKLMVPDVVFIGHLENDGRDAYIKALLDAQISVGLNSTWEDFERDNPYIIRMENTERDYNEILNKAKIGIVFLSKRNSDTYTRRCFEIPIVKTLMIAPYNDDLSKMFVEGKEAVFYRDKKDFVNKIKYFLKYEEQRKVIAEAGYIRVLKGKNDVSDRISQILDDYEEHIGKGN